ncbi:hypothetical protein [Streptomyces sp.]|uniref:hypothetical protein n=1 Tax=Streptomyces sp. TaxID=1931 RepID=UPI002F426D16
MAYLVGAVGAVEPIPGLKGASAFVLIAAVVVIIAGIAVLPLIMDVRRATDWRQQITNRLIDQAHTDPGIRDFLRDLREPRGVRGLTRSIIAVLILALVGFALAVAMLSSGGDAGDLRKTIVTSLMTVLATVAGFYFGSLGAQNSAEDARRHAARHTGRDTLTATAGPGGNAEVSVGEGSPEGGAVREEPLEGTAAGASSGAGGGAEGGGVGFPEGGVEGRSPGAGGGVEAGGVGFPEGAPKTAAEGEEASEDGGVPGKGA